MDDDVMIGMDPHKASNTIAVPDRPRSCRLGDGSRTLTMASSRCSTRSPSAQ